MLLVIMQVSGVAEVICLLVIQTVGKIMKGSGCENVLTVGYALRKRKGGGRGGHSLSLAIHDSHLFVHSNSPQLSRKHTTEGLYTSISIMLL